MKTTLSLLALAVALLGGLAPAAQADLILQPAAASTNMGTGAGSPDNTINQSGLSAGYTSLVTDFDTYIASNPTHNNNPIANRWLSAVGTTTGNFDFALGGTFTIQSFALWNRGRDQAANIIGFELLADDNAAFSSPTSLGSFGADPNTGPGTAVLPEVFTFTPTSAAFVRMRITSNNSAIATLFGEAAFEVQSAPAAVPEPASLALLAAGGLGLLSYGWRRQKRQPAYLRFPHPRRRFMKPTLTFLALAVALLGGLAPAAHADIMTPAGLNPGDQFRIIFVSSAARDATSSDIADYDAFITNLAIAAGLTYNGAAVTWQALGSTPTVAANSSGRLPVDPSSPPLYRLDGVKVADNTDDLWNASIDATINVTETGIGGVQDIVWTGTGFFGASDTGEELGGPSMVATYGSTESSGADWVNFASAAAGEQHRLYGYSEVLTVPGTAVVPEPASVTLVLVGLAGLAGYGWRRRNRAA